MFSALAAADVDQLRDVLGRAAGGEAKQGLGVLERQAADLVGDQASLARRDADVAGAGVDERGDGSSFGAAFLAGLRAGAFAFEPVFAAAGFPAASFAPVSAVFEVASAAVSPAALVAVSFFAAGLRAAGFFAPSLLGAAFFAAGFFAAGLRAAGFLAAAPFSSGFDVGFFSSAIAYSLCPCPAPEWARKVRVGANSPSLWPTIDSEM